MDSIEGYYQEHRSATLWNTSMKPTHFPWCLQHSSLGFHSWNWQLRVCGRMCARWKLHADSYCCGQYPGTASPPSPHLLHHQQEDSFQLLDHLAWREDVLQMHRYIDTLSRKLFVVVCSFVCWDRVSLAVLELILETKLVLTSRDPSVSQILGLKVCATTIQFWKAFKICFIKSALSTFTVHRGITTGMMVLILLIGLNILLLGKW